MDPQVLENKVSCMNTSFSTVAFNQFRKIPPKIYPTMDTAQDSYDVMAPPGIPTPPKASKARAIASSPVLSDSNMDTIMALVLTMLTVGIWYFRVKK